MSDPFPMSSPAAKALEESVSSSKRSGDGSFKTGSWSSMKSKVSDIIKGMGGGGGGGEIYIHTYIHIYIYIKNVP